MYSRCTYTCPFFKVREQRSVKCEGGDLRFHDGKSTVEYVARYCSADEWKRCSLAAALLRYYERQENEDAKQR